MDEVEGRLQVDVEDGIPLCLRHAEHQAVLGDSGIVDEDVDAAEVGVDLLHDGLGLGKVGGIARIGAAGDAQGLDLLACGLKAGSHVVVEDKVGECDVSALAGELHRHGLANTTGCTRNQCCFSC